MRRGGMTSITAQLRRSVGTIALLLTVPAVIGLVMMILYSSRTQAMIRRMDSAAEMKPALENTIAENLFSVAAGRCSFRERDPDCGSCSRGIAAPDCIAEDRQGDAQTDGVHPYSDLFP